VRIEKRSAKVLGRRPHQNGEEVARLMLDVQQSLIIIEILKAEMGNLLVGECYKKNWLV